MRNFVNNVDVSDVDRKSTLRRGAQKSKGAEWKRIEPSASAISPLKPPESTKRLEPIELSENHSTCQNIPSRRHTDDPFRPSENELCVTIVYISGLPETIHFHSGSEISYISKSFCERARIGLREENCEPKMANKTTEPLESNIERAPISIGPYSEAFRCTDCTLNHYLILGKNGLVR